MVEQFMEGDIAGARRIQLEYLPFIQALFKEPNPIPVKAGAALLGFDVGDARLPLTAPLPQTVELLRACMKSVGLGVKVGV
jgi:4-hydroxy-tetrahydrodipicolinate synthase